MPGTLYLVATPIGNLTDINYRAIDILRRVDLIACEDTRHTRKLLSHFEISNKLVSYHEHNERDRAREMADRLARGESIAVVSDAGTPGINDPAFGIVQLGIEIGASIVSVPGPVAFVTGVVASGLPTDSIFFGGFLPARQGERRARLREVSEIPATLAFYEAPHRLARSIADCAHVLGDRQAVIARELTKVHEEYLRGTLASLSDQLSKSTIRGEIVLLIDRPRVESASAVADSTMVAARVAELEGSGLDQKSALKQAAREFGMSKSAAYRLLLESKKTQL